MTAVALVNYLEDSYLVGPPGYLGGTFGEVSGMQAQMKIDDAADDTFEGMQVEMKIATRIDTGMQTQMKVFAFSPEGMQAELLAVGINEPTGFQVDQIVGQDARTGMQTTIGKLFHAYHPKYLVAEEEYMTYSYLAYKRCAFLGMQVEAKIVDEADDRFEGMQADMKVVDFTEDYGMQSQMKITDLEPKGMQVNMVRTTKTGMQINFIIYNTTQLRFLCNFASRGVSSDYNVTPGGDNANWQTDQTMAADDLGKLGNLNTDVFEQRIQTDSAVAFWELRCDTGLNTFIDTLFIGDHNFTKSATIQVQGSDSPTFASVSYSFNVSVNNGFDLVNAYYIAEDPPIIGSRYARLLISDPANPDGHLRIGIIAFGSSDIFTPRECFDNPVQYGFEHFKDTVDTEGFSNNSNDRATRKKLSLNFTNLRLQSGNFALLRRYMATAKTDLKCLIIPYPERAAALAVFSKLVALPGETHNASQIEEGDPLTDEWLVSLSLDWDESL